ncbi:MAG: phosphoribosylglycinamide formyltransferase [Tannerella sp.]|jgi:phosphoribosylglycinamide formyltransferase-1|nr:phosphoribosylglycinamide formyltransferase [Tannerella sp.]
MKKIALFASGSGTNAENIIRYFEGNADVEVALVVSNKSEAFVHERAQRLGVPSVTHTNAEFRESMSVLYTLNNFGIDFVALAGFMYLLPPAIIDTYRNRIVNIHPSLLPKYGGKGMYGHHVHEAVVAAGEKQSGITIHYVDKHYDEGDIVFQAKCEVLPTDTPADVERKIHQLEYLHYPRVIESILKEKGG